MKNAGLALWVIIIGAICSGAWFGMQRGYRIESVFNSKSPPPGENFDAVGIPILGDREGVAFQLISQLNSSGYRFIGGKLERLYPLDRHQLSYPFGDFALIGDKCYYTVGTPGGALVCFENGAETQIATADSAAFLRVPHASFEQVDSDGTTLVVSLDNSGVFRLRNGKFEMVCPRSVTGHAPLNQLIVDGDRVYMNTDKALFVSVDGKVTKVVSQGDVMPDGVVLDVEGFSAAGGVVVMMVELRDGSPHTRLLPYVHRNGRTERLGGDPHPIDALPTFGGGISNLCTNGDSIVIAEYWVGWMRNIGTSRRPENSNHHSAIVVNRHGWRQTVAAVGDELGGSVLRRFIFGPRAMDSAGNLAFRYSLSNGSQGIALARPTFAPTLYAGLSFAVAVAGLLFKFGVWIRKPKISPWPGE